MNTAVPSELSKAILSLPGLACWYVSCGGAAGSTFELSFGQEVRRRFPLKNSAHSAEFRQFEGEVSLLVWCAWRLDSPDTCLTSWDDTNDSVERELTKLVGARVRSIDLVGPCWDINLMFSNSLCLRVFCDHVPGEPSFDGNWDLTTQEVLIAIGPGTNYTIEDRQSKRAEAR
jgi:hypothetical protein